MTKPNQTARQLRTRKKYAAAIEATLKMLTKAPRTGSELADFYKSIKTTSCITALLVDNKLASGNPSGRHTVYTITTKGMKRAFKMKTTLDRYFSERSAYNSEQGKRRKAQGTPLPPPPTPASIKAALVEASKAALVPPPATPQPVQLPLFDTPSDTKLLTFDQWVRQAKAQGFKITREL